MFVHCVDQYLGERMMAENRLWRLVYAVELQVHYFLTSHLHLYVAACGSILCQSALVTQ
jgi:hypothetical protein